MIVLKQLAWELRIEPQPLRSILRKRLGVRKRWRWEDDSEELIMIKRNFPDWFAKTRAGLRANSTRAPTTPQMIFTYLPAANTSAMASSKSLVSH